MALNIVRVLALPTPVVANTIYLVGKTATDLQIVAVGSNITDIRKTPVVADINDAIVAAIGNLDLSNTVLFAADIAARNAMNTLTKSSFVFVADATGDPTVGTGSATYFFNVASVPGSQWTKVSEYESMDVVIPNKAILEKFSEVGGELLYGNKPLGTVVAGTMEW